MSDGVADNVGALVRRLSRLLHRKIADVLALAVHHKSVGSLGAVAGLAIACIFAWKLLRRSPGRRVGGRRKHRGSPSTSQAVAGDDSLASEGDLSVGPLKDANAVETVASAAELSLGQIVRKRLGGCRRITCQLLGVILQEKTPEELQKHATIRLPVLEVVKEICKHCDLYLMETVLDDESEERVLSALENSGIFQSGGLIKDKVLFCSTETGRISFVRQLEADWHIDSNLDIISQLSRFIRFQLYISQMDSGQIAPNVFTSTSLEQLFS
ncbi:peroxisome biogenesis protein 22-like [Zingiber officinale]|uniref:peroxisome biogenesis protein 22-like n=1 Tax=Zingiber officinale TaxID=94328 RepID=UPI001C4DD323|nr:peroxisome biogenesis protein 22-like [Zingiber officinale]